MKRIDKIKSMDAAEMIFDIGADCNINFCQNKVECAEMLDGGEADEVNLMLRRCLAD